MYYLYDIGNLNRKATMCDKPASDICTNEANLIWDEYKYRHDLIWRQLIRSTVAVIALITVSYSTSIEGNKPLFLIAAGLAVGYSIFNIFIVHSELGHYHRVRDKHTSRQADLYSFPYKERQMSKWWKFWKWHLFGFSARVYYYLFGLLLLALLAAATQVYPSRFGIDSEQRSSELTWRTPF